MDNTLEVNALVRRKELLGPDIEAVVYTVFPLLIKEAEENMQVLQFSPIELYDWLLDDNRINISVIYRGYRDNETTTRYPSISRKDRSRGYYLHNLYLTDESPLHFESDRTATCGIISTGHLLISIPTLTDNTPERKPLVGVTKLIINKDTMLLNEINLTPNVFGFHVYGNPSDKYQYEEFMSFKVQSIRLDKDMTEGFNFVSALINLIEPEGHELKTLLKLCKDEFNFRIVCNVVEDVAEVSRVEFVYNNL